MGLCCKNLKKAEKYYDSVEMKARKSFGGGLQRPVDTDDPDEENIQMKELQHNFKELRKSFTNRQERNKNLLCTLACCCLLNFLIIGLTITGLCFIYYQVHMAGREKTDIFRKASGNLLTQLE